MADKIVLADTSVLIDYFRKTDKNKSHLILLYIADLFIAATATSRNLPLATLNKKHFERIDSLQII